MYLHKFIMIQVYYLVSYTKVRIKIEESIKDAIDF